MQLLGVGVDVVDVGRMRRFLSEHGRRRAGRILSAREMKRFRGRKISPVQFAKLFAAKEAFFKSLNRSWLGVEGFRDLEIVPLSAHRFQARTAARKGSLKAEGHFFRKERWVGAQVVLWER